MATYSQIATAFTTGVYSGPIATSDSGGSGAIDTTGATLIVAFAGVLGGSVPDISDSAGNTWGAPTTGHDVSDTKVAVWLLQNPTTSASHVFTLTGPTVIGSLTVIAFSGDLPGTLIDASSTGSGGSGTSVSAGSVSPTQNNDLILAFITRGGAGDFSINGGFTLARTFPGISSTAYASAFAYLIQTTATTASPTWSWTPSTNSATLLLALRSGDTSGGGSSAGAAAHYYRQMQ